MNRQSDIGEMAPLRLADAVEIAFPQGGIDGFRPSA